MRILYIGVHSHKGWGAEFWLVKAFNNIGIEYELLDYREEFKNINNQKINEIIDSKSKTCDLIFLQRGNDLSPNIFNNIKIPIIFWSTEPIRRNRDVDKLLRSNIFSWVYLHLYSCQKRIVKEFPHLANRSSVMHNAAPIDQFNFSAKKNIYAIFNRSLSLRRRYWLWPSKNQIVNINGRYGNDYFNDLNESSIAINIHFSRKSLDDFETGIFEALASGCVVLSERLHKQTLIDLGMEDAIIQVDSPLALKQKLIYLKQNPNIIKYYQKESKLAIEKNTWHERAKIMQHKFEEICDQ